MDFKLPFKVGDIITYTQHPIDEVYKVLEILQPKKDSDEALRCEVIFMTEESLEDGVGTEFCPTWYEAKWYLRVVTPAQKVLYGI